MPEQAIKAILTQSIVSSAPTYAEAHDAGVGSFYRSGNVGQRYMDISGSNKYRVIRMGLIFDLSVIPLNVVITAVTMRYRVENDYSDTDFNVAVVEGTFGSSFSYDDFDEFETTSFGSVSTNGISPPMWMSFTINSTGLLKIDEQFPNIKLGLVSDRDISETAPSMPDHYEYLDGLGYLDPDYPPELIVTYSDWPNERYPEDPSFPTIGRVDLDTLAVIQAYIEDLTDLLGQMTDGDANIDFQDPDNYIIWDGTPEKISYDSVNDRVEFNKLVSGFAITLGDDLFCNNLQVTTAIDVQGDTPSIVSGDANFSDTAYASEQDSLTDNELWHDANTGIIGFDPDEAFMYQLNSDGDFIVAIELGAGIKTAILVDFSEI